MLTSRLQRWWWKHRYLRIAAAVLAGFVLFLFAAILGTSAPLLATLLYATFLVAALLSCVVKLRGNRVDLQRICFDDRICPQCHYPLTDLPHRGDCPECGTPYTHRQVEQYWQQLDADRRGETPNPYQSQP